MRVEEGKACRICGQVKPKAEMVKHNKTLAGVTTLCLKCRSGKRRAEYVPHPISPKWSEEKIMAAAKAFSSKVEFSKGNLAAYTAALRSDKGIDYFCSHMVELNRSWTFEKILAEAKKFNTIRDFRIGDPAAYCAGLRSGRKDELYAHMSKKGESASRFIYVIQSTTDAIAYVGLSENPRRRYREHRANGRKVVRNLIAGPHTFSVVYGPVSEDDAILLEMETVSRMASDGFRMLNAAKPGALGVIGSIKWTREGVLAEAQKYNSIAAFQKGSPGAYGAATKRFGGVAQFCEHMTFSLRKWDADAIREEALKHGSRKEFEDACGSAYNAARRLGIMDDVCSHMKVRGRPAPANDNVAQREMVA